MSRFDPRPIRIEGDTAYVPLTKGYEAVIDAADVELVASRRWFANVSTWSGSATVRVYAAATIRNTTVSMHKLLLIDAGKMQVDHIDGDGLNNRRSNLRLVSTAQNQWNQRRHSDNTSGVKGVHRSSRDKKWCAQIRVSNKVHSLGHFDTLEAAAAAYAEASKRLHGEFGRLA